MKLHRAYTRLSAWSLAALLVVAGLIPALEAKTAHAIPSPVIVSLTFDDTIANNMDALPAMNQYGYKGTFYVNSPRIGQSGYFSLAQVNQLKNAGHEIGGHTLHHIDLTTLPETSGNNQNQTTQICTDRQNLVGLGFNPVSIAYPFGEFNGITKKVAAGCGYNSGRGTGGIYGTTYAETAPPLDMYGARSFGSIQKTTTVASMLARVDNAANNGGGWLPYIFHHICPDSNPDCNQYGITVSNFDAFVDGLHARSNVTVKTVQQMTPVLNPSLEADANSDAIPDCWVQQSAAGTHTYTSARTTDARTGAYAWNIAMSNYVSGDRKLINAPSCYINTQVGVTRKVEVYYKATAGSQVRFAAYKPNGSGWAWFAQSPTYGSASDWTKVSWTVTPQDTKMRIGFSLFSNGNVTFDDFAVY